VPAVGPVVEATLLLASDADDVDGEGLLPDDDVVAGVSVLG
jgi:hypothetical protein